MKSFGVASKNNKINAIGMTNTKIQYLNFRFTIIFFISFLYEIKLKIMNNAIIPIASLCTKINSIVLLISKSNIMYFVN